MNKILKITKYQILNNIRSKWILFCLAFFAIFAYWIISFSGEASKILISMMNLVLIVLPLISVIFGTIYIYSNSNYIKFMLTQPLNRSSLYYGLYFGLTLPLMLSFTVGMGIPVFINLGIFTGSFKHIIILFITGLFQILVFSSFAFLIAILNEDRIKGIGFAIFIWLFFAVIYDGLLLFLLQIFQDYPLENLALIMTVLNPVDLGRIIVILNLDVSALMGYTGAVFENFFGHAAGLSVSLLVLLIWSILPFYAGLRKFSRRDI